MLSSVPGTGAAVIRSSTASRTWSATVRPKRASHACGIASEFSMVPVASPSAMRTFSDGLDSVSVIVSEPSLCASSSTSTETVRLVTSGAKVSVPDTAV